MTEPNDDWPEAIGTFLTALIFLLGIIVCCYGDEILDLIRGK